MAERSFSSVKGLSRLLTLSQKTLEPQTEITYVPFQTDRAAAGQSYEDFSALLKQARQHWGYESLQSLILHPSLNGNAHFETDTMPDYVA
jgi:hypothetical protein